MVFRNLIIICVAFMALAIKILFAGTFNNPNLMEIPSNCIDLANYEIVEFADEELRGLLRLESVNLLRSEEANIIVGKGNNSELRLNMKKYSNYFKGHVSSSQALVSLDPKIREIEFKDDFGNDYSYISGGGNNFGYFSTFNTEETETEDLKEFIELVECLEN